MSRLSGLALFAFLFLLSSPVQAQIIYDVVYCTGWWFNEVDFVGTAAWNWMGVSQKTGEAFKLYKQCRDVFSTSHATAWNAIKFGSQKGSCKMTYGIKDWPGPGGDSSGKAFNHLITSAPNSFLPQLEVAFRKAYDLEKAGKSFVTCEEVYGLADASSRTQLTREQFQDARVLDVQARTPATLVPLPGGDRFAFILDSEKPVTVKVAGKTHTSGPANQFDIGGVDRLRCGGVEYAGKALSHPVRLSQVNCRLERSKSGDSIQLAIRSNPLAEVALAMPGRPSFACNDVTCVPADFRFTPVTGGFRVRAIVDEQAVGLEGAFTQWSATRTG